MKAPSTSRARRVLVVAALVAVATVGTWTQRAAFPLLNDDVAYLGTPCEMAHLGSLEWGPAYAALYCGLRRVVADPFLAFWVKQAMVLLLAGVLVHLLGRRFGLGPAIAPLAGLWCVLALLSPNGTLEFAFVLGLVACLCAASDRRAGWVGFFIVMGLAFLVRTEYVIGIAAALALLSWRQYRKRANAGGAALMGAVVLATCLALAWGRVPREGGRSWFAFGQQFAVNRGEAHAVSDDPLVDWQRIAAQSFPTSASIPEAARENPRMFAWHLGYNFLNRLPRALARLLLPVPSFATWPSPWSAALGMATVITVLLAALRGAVETRRLGDPRVAPLLALAVIPVVSLVFRPQARHLLAMVPLLVVLAGRGLGSGVGRVRPGLRVALTATLSGLLLAGALSPWAVWATTSRVSPSLADRIRELGQAAQARPVRVLASWYANRVCALVGARCEVVSLGERGETNLALSDAIDAEKVDAVLIDPQWAARPDVQADARVREFVAEPGRFGCLADPPDEGLRFVRCPSGLKLARP